MTVIEPDGPVRVIWTPTGMQTITPVLIDGEPKTLVSKPVFQEVEI